MATEEFWHFSKLLYEKDVEGHHDTADCNIRTLPFTSCGTLPKYTPEVYKEGLKLTLLGDDRRAVNLIEAPTACGLWIRTLFRL